MCASSMASSSEKAWGSVLTPSPKTRIRASASSRPFAMPVRSFGSAPRTSRMTRGMRILSFIGESIFAIRGRVFRRFAFFIAIR